MSDPNNPPGQPPPPEMPPLPPRSGWVTALMVLVGVILLLPGLCALGFGVLGLSGPPGPPGSGADTIRPLIMPFVVVGLLVGFGGIMLIRAAIRGRPR
jgi:hypothetical protein